MATTDYGPIPRPSLAACLVTQHRRHKPWQCMQKIIRLLSVKSPGGYIGKRLFPNQTMSIDGSAVLVIRFICNLSPVYLTNHQDLSSLLCQILPFRCSCSRGRQTCVTQSPLQELSRCPAVGCDCPIASSSQQLKALPQLFKSRLHSFLCMYVGSGGRGIPSPKLKMTVVQRPGHFPTVHDSSSRQSLCFCSLRG